MKKFKELREAANLAQQAAIAINMKKQGKTPKKMSEEIELDEVSKSTLGKYVNKARSDRMDALHSSYRNADDNYEADEKDNKRVEKRDRGINLARAKINKFGKSGNTIAKVKATESVEEVKEDKYDRMLSNMIKKNPDVLKTHAKEVQKYNDINSGKTLKQNIKKNPGVLKTHSDAVKKAKTMYGEDVESVEEGIMNAVKNLASKASKALTGGSDEDQRKDLQRKMGVPQTGKKPMQK